MLSPFNLLLITAGFSVVMLFVLGSLMRSHIPGLREWAGANALAAIALVLLACRGLIPNFLSIVVANTLAGLAICIIYLGFRRYYGLLLPLKPIALSLLALFSLFLVFHYVYDSIAIRTVIVSWFLSIYCLAIGLLIFQSSHRSLTLSPYPARFTAWVSILFFIGYGLRAVVYMTGTDHLVSAMQASSWNLLFLSLGTLVMPLLTMGAIMMVHDRMLSKAIQDANHDFLTGAWTRRAFFEFAERELLRAKRMKRSLSLLMFDVDYFKRINDTYGHATGDNVLIDIVERAQLEIRNIDYIARMGGEEFSILLPEADANAALAIAERLRARLNSGTSIVISPGQQSTEKTVPYTVSIGVATHRADEGIIALMHRADIALYSAKAAGRNIVITAEEAMAREA
ncbi:MAG: GGDEF domain-containing protein [Oxalicibacterium faecigallinarum]|uniref:GGDEF domain-containing protein n=1 Tax=Oxalicibacterium faecigallinarum TaxID=573741 RepID=UPI0028094F3E|nr:GGDEF domain-containing protein [Oxalicibacterium faecigallinarum]MDQ7968379.1 GGDEF domain-containing protein [Oxalicibacterium faecigallinarum]